MNDYTAAIMILKSLAINLPILRSWGYVFPRLLTIVVNQGKMAMLMDTLRVFPREYAEKNLNSEFRFHFFPKGYAHQKEQSEIALRCKTDNTGTNGLDVVITDDEIVEDLAFDKFFIFFDDSDFPTVSLDLQDFVPKSNDLKFIMTSAERINQDEAYSVEQQVLNVAALFIEPYLRKGHTELTIEQILDTVNRLCAFDENVRETNDISNVFCVSLENWRKNQQELRIVDLNNRSELTQINWDDISEILFFKGKYLYIRESKFKSILEETNLGMPINLVKSKLRDAGVLATENNRTPNYVTKLRYVDSDGVEHSLRMMRFDLEKLSIPGELSFKDKCYFLGGHGNDSKY